VRPTRVRFALKSRLRLPTKKVRALALDAIEKQVASRAADLAPTDQAAGRRQATPRLARGGN
jgi:hypothetical protein